MRGRPVCLRALTAEERPAVEALARSRTAPARRVERARIVWHASRGETPPAIAAALGVVGRTQAKAIRARETDHVHRLSALVRDLGGTPPQGRPRGEYRPMFPKLDDEAAALRFARDLEERLVRGYLDALRSLPDSDHRRVAAEIAAEEAEDLAVVQLLSGDAAAPKAFVTGTS